MAFFYEQENDFLLATTLSSTVNKLRPQMGKTSNLLGLRPDTLRLSVVNVLSDLERHRDQI